MSDHKHSAGFIKLTEVAKSEVPEVSVEQVELLQADGATIIDVREDHEREIGYIPGSIHLSKGIIERDIEEQVAKETKLVLYCNGGYRSLLAGQSIKKMGYTDVLSLVGGWKAWVAYKQEKP